MIVLWMTLFVLRQGCKGFFVMWKNLRALIVARKNSLVPVKTVQLGQPVTLTCALPKGLQSGEVHWYKQNHGDTLKLIMTSFKSTPAQYGPAFSRSRFEEHNDNNFSNVTILKTVQEDEGIYHCGLTEWIRTNWSGTYLFVKGKLVVQQLTGSNPIHPGDTVTFQCSVSHSVNKTCPGGLRVLWFRDRSHESHPVIYANTHNECEKRSDTQRTCVYHFSKNVSSSDGGTYYCAVATCGEILFGNGTTLELGMILCSVLFLQIALIVCLAISVSGNIFLVCKRRICTPIKGKTDEELNYAALNFSERKTRGRKKREPPEESVYSQVK
uniref:Ig-like domain-containing protein n=1 Tax=Astatotilapia calliptera TaxID=8154 RepID=A0A3P8NKI0_ASTCA